MSREYAVRKSSSPEKILYQSVSFDVTDITDILPLSQGMELLISGRDDDSKVADLQKQLSEAQDANKAKEVFLSNMSHDIRTPMNAIIGMTALAKKHIDEKNKVLDSLNKIDTASSHLLSLINEVLDMSRINSGKMVIAKELFSISDLLHDTLAIVRPQAQQKNHHFLFTADRIHTENLYGDVQRLFQIMVNIINNSIKYTNEGGEITVSISEEVEGDICHFGFMCKDNGNGMSEEFLQKIFEPFERASSSTMSGIEGTGLGMSIVKKLIEAMDGTIMIQSKLSQGTTVLITIPMKYEKLDIDTSSLENKNLLIIENNEQLKETYRQYLSEFDISFDIADSSSEAIAAISDNEFHNQKYDALIIGTLSRMDGNIYDIASYFHKADQDLKIILVSDDNWDEIEYRASRNGIQSFIPLPFFRKSLLNSLNQALGQDRENETSSLVPDLCGKTILLVEDNFINREIAKEILSSTNATIETAENGKEAVDKYLEAEDGHYSLILMDIQMPIMDGYEASRNIRSSNKPDAEKIRIFAMTANTFVEDIAKAREAGMNGHIAKPIDINKLMLTLKQNT